MSLFNYRNVLVVIILGSISPYAWWLSDRSPPWVRLSGTIVPTHAGASFSVNWNTTPLLRECPGTLQVEISSGLVVWPVLRRQVNSELSIGQTDYTTPPWPLALAVPIGKATYRVTSFWYCNWLQEKLGWPIIQVGPDIEFDVLPPVFPPGTTLPTTRPPE